ncbi:hypothetical protein MJ258_15380, partial [Legionella sp. EUR-108]|nr:hypothetical protein [Legionella maioricensis]
MKIPHYVRDDDAYMNPGNDFVSTQATSNNTENVISNVVRDLLVWVLCLHMKIPHYVRDDDAYMNPGNDFVSTQ